MHGDHTDSVIAEFHRAGRNRQCQKSVPTVRGRWSQKCSHEYCCCCRCCRRGRGRRCRVMPTITKPVLCELMQCENCEKITGELANMGRGAAGAVGVGFGEGVCPLPRKMFNFLAQNSAFWHIF